MHNLAIALRGLFEQFGRINDLNESIQLERAAFTILDAKQDPDRSMAMDGLSLSLSMRSKLTGNSRDAEEAVVASRAAVAASPVGSNLRPAYLNSLANRLTSRFRLYKDRHDLDAAIEAASQAVTASAGDLSLIHI